MKSFSLSPLFSPFLRLQKCWGLIGCILGLLLICSTLGYATPTSAVQMTLIKGGEDMNHTYAGLLLTIPKNWHVYGPTPPDEEGGAGFPPNISWDTSKNIRNVDVLCPSARKTKLQDQTAYVYDEGQILIPLKVTPTQKDAPLTLNLKVSMLACADVCTPLNVPLSLTIQPGEAADPRYKQAGTTQDMSLSMLLWFALLGGLILNFMPCVLPVLSLKVMSLIKQSKKHHRSHAKVGFFLTGLGILTSFFLLACLTIILKESGEAFGWGIHFQNSHFLLFILLVLVAFTASLWGVFEIDLPPALGNFFITHEGKGHVKDFLSGVFATLLATPCSAPFLGTALSFALARSPHDIFLVFFCLGLGFASPYFLVASLPARFIILPKPGMWMVWTQKILGLFLGLTALWIGWVLSFHLAPWILSTSVLLALIALALFWVKHHKHPSLHVWRFALPLFAIAWGLSWIPHTLTTSQSINASRLWKSFDVDKIPALVKSGKVVFVDVTAEWCVTCAVNKQLVLTSADIEKRLMTPSVVAMKADWTKKDEKVTQFLQHYGRYGIPFNIVFGPGAPEGIALPVILTSNLVKEALQKAGPTVSQ